MKIEMGKGSFYFIVKCLIVLLCITASTKQGYSQENKTQTIHGIITDRDSEFSIPGVNVYILHNGNYLGTISDSNGEFVIENIPLGRHTVNVSCLGYKNVVIPNVLVGSAKEVVLNIEMEETNISLSEVEIKPDIEKEKALSEMTLISARTFSVEETGKYAGSINDPGRMALSFAGVSGGGNDATNEIVIRGNSPRGMLWQIEGIPVTNPNHFGEEGQTGGGICLLSNNLLDNSDFITGAWAPGYGNALSGVFDIKLRKGNNRKRENSFQISTLGIDAAIEGPIKKGSNGSYLINYRYSTFGMLEKMGVYVFDENDGVPLYQDLSYHIFLPAKKAGIFSLWGIMGKSEMTSKNVVENIKIDNIEFNDLDNSRDYSKADNGIFGLTHKYFIGNKSYLKTGLSLSASQLVNEEDGRLEPLKAISKIGLEEKDDFTKFQSVFTTHYNIKLSKKHTFRAGIIGTNINYDTYKIEYNTENQMMETEVDGKGTSNLIQSYALSKYKFTDDLVLVAGLHSMYYDLSKKTSIEPRLALNWQVNPIHSLSFGFGQHSQLQPLSLYVYDHPELGRINEDLDFSKATHYVISYNYQISENLRLKTDLYYQQLYSIPVAKDTTGQPDRLGSYSAINFSDGIDYMALQNQGKGKNYGVEFTLEKFFSDSWYFLLTMSLYESKYKGVDGIQRNTKYYGNYIANFLAGKEFEFANKNILGINVRIIAAGGQRFTPVYKIMEATDDLGSSITDFKGDQVYYPVYDHKNAFSKSLDDYLRIDFGMSYRMNRNKVAHIISLDIQNLTNRKNIWQIDDFDANEMKYEYEYQASLIPVLKYRVEF